MKAWKDYDKTAIYAGGEKLPAGGYVLRVTESWIANGASGQQLVLEYDIAEGDYAGYFGRNYDAQPEDSKKWKGTYRIFCPRDDGSERDEWAKRRFKTAMVAFEQSNAGYKWNWDENTLRGKLVGALFNRKEYDFEGRHGFFTNCYSLTDAGRIRSGNFTIPPDTLLKGDAGNGRNEKMPYEMGFVNIPDGIDEELPFN